MDFNHSEKEAIEEIECIRSGIEGLVSHGSYQAISTGPLTRGCQICTKMRSMTFVLGYRCNASCRFCFAPSYQSDKYDEDEKYNRHACFKQFLRDKDNIQGVGFTGGETFLYLDKIAEYTEKIRDEKPDIYFWIYTNGIEASPKNLKTVRSFGIDEIRFNLAATGYSDKIIKKLGEARKLFDYLVVEVPSYPEQKEQLIGCLDRLEYYSIDQLTLQELLINGNNINNLSGEGYQSGMMFSKKFFLYGSRKMTYEIIRYCLDRNYSFTVNDCSPRKFGIIG
jgi:uncharacterized protein